MRGLYLLLFLLAIPLLAALGHDIYIAYGEEMDFSKPLRFSELGWVWMRYEQDSHAWALNNFDRDLWNTYIVPILTQKTVLVALVPMIFVSGLIVLVKLYQMSPWYGNVSTASSKMKLPRKMKKSSFSFEDLDGRKERARYKRK